jgi:hypothetical protein
MTRETKIGMVVASSFLALVGVVVANKLKKPADAKEDASAQQWITPKDTKVADAGKPETKEKKPTTLPAAFLTEEKPPIDLPPASGNVTPPAPPANGGFPGLPGLPDSNPGLPPLAKENGLPGLPPAVPNQNNIEQQLLAQREKEKAKEGFPPLPPAGDGSNPLPKDTGLPPLPKDVGLPGLPKDGGLPPLPKDTGLPPLPKDTGLPPPPSGQEPKEPAKENNLGLPPFPPAPSGTGNGNPLPPFPPMTNDKKDPLPPPTGSGMPPLPPVGNDNKDPFPPLPPFGSDKKDPAPPVGSGLPPLPPIGSGSKDPLPPITNDKDKKDPFPPLPPIGSNNPLPPIGSSNPPLPPIGSGNPSPGTNNPLPPLGAENKNPLPPIGKNTDPLPPIGKPDPMQPVIGLNGNTPPSPPPFSNEKPQPPVGSDPFGAPRVTSFDFTTYKCQPEDTSFDILSTRHYKTAKYAKALELYNRDHPLAKENLRSTPPRLYPGGDVFIPAPGLLETKYAAFVGDRPAGPGPGPGSGSGQPVVGLPTVGTPMPLNPNPGAGDSAVGGNEARAYQVPAGKGQMLFEIAQQTLGNPVRWNEIYRLNPQIRPDQPIPPGTTLRIPAR